MLLGIICVVACINTLFLFMTEWYPSGDLFMQSAVDGYLESFPPSGYWNNVSLNVCVHVFVWVPAFNSCGHILRSGIAGSYDLSLALWGTAKLFFQTAKCWLRHFTLSTSSVQEFKFSTSLPTLVIFHFLITVILMGVKWLLLMVLICISLMSSWC